MDGDGYFYYRARMDDMIISAGYNIAGVEVEEALLRHPAVAECAVIGRPDEERGQVVEAHVVVRAGQEADAALACELQEFTKRRIAPYKYPRRIFTKRRIAPYKYPRRIVFRDALPRTETGKLQRFKLRAEAAPAQNAG
ncbi:AMP-binding enzyme [Massilia brevitalea]|uniref:AMP-binding enzyme n=1 Tax=Massilia brevitalea TaxID=442526 RepID=UPI0028039CAF|nr:hypothetical protein [Massilia brevitalea]